MRSSVQIANGVETVDAAAKTGLSLRYIQKLCADGRIAGAQQFGRTWLVGQLRPYTQRPETSRSARAVDPKPSQVAYLHLRTGHCLHKEAPNLEPKVDAASRR